MSKRKILFCWLIGLAGLAFLLYRSAIRPMPEIDFRFFWLAGHIWATGGDPYGPDYPNIAAQVLPAGNRTPGWVYPPHWWVICRALAALPLLASVMAWRLLAAALIWIGSWLAVDALVAGERRTVIAVAMATAGLASLIEPTANLLALGQTGGLLFFGLCLLAAGVAGGRGRIDGWLVGGAALLLSLKPQLGLPVILALLVVPRFRLPVVLAGIVGLVLALPQLLSFGPVTTLHEWLGNLSHYNDHAGPYDDGANSVLSCTGPLHLLARIFPIHPNPMLQLGLALAVALAAGVMLRDAQAARRGLLLLLVAVVSLMPLHIYDMTMIVVPLLLLYAMAGRLRWPMILIFALVIRPGKIEDALHVPVYGGGVSGGTIGLSLAGLLLLIVALSTILRRSAEDQPAG